MKIYGNLVGGTSGSNSKKLPEFTYTGAYETVMDDGGWKIKFKTSGTFSFTKPNTLDIDAFLVGGGGAGNKGGGGGGYTKTVKNIQIIKATNYFISVGAGGVGVAPSSVRAADGGISSAFGYTANGGLGSTNNNGGSGGSGGGGAGGSGSFDYRGYNGHGGSGGSDGADGSAGENGYEVKGSTHYGGAGGIGQGITTREFGEIDKEIYAGGGGAAAGVSRVDNSNYGGSGGNGANGGSVGNNGGTPQIGGTGGITQTGSNRTAGGGGGGGNYGGGGGGANDYFLSSVTAGNGFQGIVIMRNNRKGST